MQPIFKYSDFGNSFFFYYDLPYPITAQAKWTWQVVLRSDEELRTQEYERSFFESLKDRTNFQPFFCMMGNTRRKCVLLIVQVEMAMSK
jgi:hypothetical protein